MSRLRPWLAAAALSLVSAAFVSGANTTNASARHLVGNGSWEENVLDVSAATAWFSTPMYGHHSYAIEAFLPSTTNDVIFFSLDIALFEADGTTPVTTTDEQFNPPNLDEQQGLNGGARRTYYNGSSDRFVHIRVRPSSGGSVPGPTPVHVRVVDMTQVAARWTVNGYTMLIAVANTSNVATTARIEYFREDGVYVAADTIGIPSNGGIQVSHPANTPIGGVLFGVVRLVPTKATPGSLTAHEYNYNAAAGNYLSFPFNPIPWVTGTPQQ